MAFCSYCGTQLVPDARFCSACGRQVASLAPETEYRLVFLSCGTCPRATARDLIEDLLGYTDAHSMQLTDIAPVEIACEMTFQQACALAQTFAEFGAEVGVYRGSEYVDIDDSASSSVFDESGDLLSDVLRVLDTLTLANQVHTYARFAHVDPRRRMFAPRC
ncbi:MAG: zinc ribbon domain-containing protein [Christensenellales bacterium]|jgi:hypothetical protein